MKIKWKFFEAADENASAGTPAPAAAETPQEPSAPVETFDADVSTDADWGDLSDDSVPDFDFGDEPPAHVEAEVTTPAKPSTEVQTPPAAEQVPPVQPETQAPEVPAQPPATPEAIRAAEMQYMQQLQGLYQFDEQTALKLQTEPEKVLPALAAKLHLDVMKTVMGQVRGMLPQMLEVQTQSSALETKAKEQFFSAWPELKGYDKQVMEVGRMFRQINPSAPAEEAVKRIGEIAMATLGMQRAAQQQAPAPAAPNAAFRPAAPGRTAAPQAPAGMWEDLLSDDD